MPRPAGQMAGDQLAQLRDGGQVRLADSVISGPVSPADTETRSTLTLPCYSDPGAGGKQYGEQFSQPASG